MSPAASELLCPACIAELKITMLAYVAAIRDPADLGRCVRCHANMTPETTKAPSPQGRGGFETGPPGGTGR